MDGCQCSDASLAAESRTSEHDPKAVYAVKEKSARVDKLKLGSFTAKEKQVKLLPKKDALRQLHKASLQESARKLQAMNKELDYEFAKHGKVQLAELAAMAKTLKKEMEIVEAVELDVSKEALWDMVKEGSSLRGLLESLKLKLETFLGQKPERKYNKENTGKMLKRKHDFEDCATEKTRCAGSWGGISESGSEEGEKNKADLLRAKSCKAAVHAAEQLRLTAGEIYGEKVAHISTLNGIATLSERTDAACVSNSESCAKIMISEEELESPRLKLQESNQSAEGDMVAALSQAGADLTESSFPEFSIRNFVYTARSKDVKKNWPFSQKSLKLCLAHGVKNVLPPFQGLDSHPNDYTRQCSTETVLHAEGSCLDEKPLWLKKQPESGIFCRGFDQKMALHCTDSNSSPSGGHEFTMKATTAHSQSEMESVSTSKVPISEVSGKQEAAVPAFRQKTIGASICHPNKKRRVVVNMGAKVDRRPAGDMTSTCIVPSEAMAPKTCPVCGNFSSSSNTTLNAHIDQCLSVEPNSDWMKSSKPVKPRIKPRKIRLMSDIYATAPSCTLEELDIRNGRTTVADFSCNAGNYYVCTSQRDPLRLVEDTGEDSAVYIDSSGTKIRILSKANDELLFPRGLEDLKVKKTLKKGKRSRLSSSKKKQFAKNLKLYQARIGKSCVGGKANLRMRRKHLEQELVPSFRIQEQDKVTDPGGSIQGLCSERTVLLESNHQKGKRGRPKCKVRATRDLLDESPESCLPNSKIAKDAKKSSAVNNTGVEFYPNNSRENTSSCKVIAHENGQGPCRRKSMTSSPLFGGPKYSKDSKLDPVTNHFSRENSFEPECSAEASQFHSSPDEEVEIHAEAGEKNDLPSHADNNVSKGFHIPKGGMRQFSPVKPLPQSGRSSIATSTYSRANTSRMDDINEITTSSSIEIVGEFSLMEADAHLHHKDELTVSDSSAKLLSGEGVSSLSRSSDPGLYRVDNAPGAESSLLQFAGNLFVAEPPAQVDQPCLGDIPELFYGIEGGLDGVEHDTENIEKQSSFSLVESIPIPGPPGSYLPSFRDSCLEYLQGSSPLTSSWLQSHDVPDVYRFNSDSSISGVSTISGSTLATAKFGASEEPPYRVPKQALLGLMDERMGSLADNVVIVAGVKDVKLTSDVESSKGCVSHQEKEPSISNVEEFQLLRPSMTITTGKADLMGHMGSSLTVVVNNLETRTAESSLTDSTRETYENPSYVSTVAGLAPSVAKDVSNAVLKSPSPSDTDSIVLSPPVLRLMGKDLMVLNNDEHATPRSQPFSNGPTSAQAPFSSALLTGRFRSSHETDPSSSHVMHAQHFKPGLTNPINLAAPRSHGTGHRG